VWLRQANIDHVRSRASSSASTHARRRAERAVPVPAIEKITSCPSPAAVPMQSLICNGRLFPRLGPRTRGSGKPALASVASYGAAPTPPQHVSSRADRLPGLNARRWDERLTPSLFLMADLVRGDAGVSARLARGALRCLGLGRALRRAAAETCAHKLLAGVALHAASLAVAILHSLLLSSQCVRGCRDCDRQNNSDNKSYHWLPPETKDTGEAGPSMQ